MSHDCAAEEIADALLYETGTALLSGDYKRFSLCFGLPLQIDTADKHSVICDHSGLLDLFGRLRHYYFDTQVVDIVRSVVDAHFLDSDTVGATHVSCLTYADGIARRKPYPVYSLISRGQNLDWRIMSRLYVILDCETHNTILSQTDRSSVAKL